ncbi:hypothetical protein N656DRAFT_777315, partial [Canariomyces notabilis]
MGRKPTLCQSGKNWRDYRWGWAPKYTSCQGEDRNHRREDPKDGLREVGRSWGRKDTPQTQSAHERGRRVDGSNRNHP